MRKPSAEKPKSERFATAARHLGDASHDAEKTLLRRTELSAPEPFEDRAKKIGLGPRDGTLARSLKRGTRER